MPSANSDYSPNFPAVENLTALRGTLEYEKRVDNIISSGILKLALAVETTLIKSSATNYENVVIAPISIAGNLKNCS